MKEIQDILKKIENFEEDQLFVIDAITGTEYSYADIYQKANYIGKNLRDRGILELIVCMENSVELLMMYFAALLYQIVIIPVDPEKSKEEIKIIRDIHSCAMYMERDYFEQVSIWNGLEMKKSFEDVDYDSLFLITYTSGSTGKPKGVRHSAGNLFLSAVSFGEHMGYGAHTILAHVMPMTYMAGILNSIFLPFVMGGKVVVFPRFNMKSAFTFWKTVTRHKVNTFWLSPTMLKIIDIIDAKGVYKDYLQNINATVSVGTAPLYKDLRDKIENKYNIRVYQSYGLSETLFLTSEKLGEDTRSDSVGQLLPGVKLKLDDDNEIQVAVPWMFRGYVNNDAYEEFLGDYYRTGDLGYIQDDCLFINGRKKDLIIRGGFNINPSDIMECLQKINGINENVVLSCVLNGEEQIICCYAGSKKQDIHLLNELLEKELGKHYKLDYLIEFDELPKNLNGKLDKQKIREMIEHDYEI
ncbi:MAG: acyl--CoA ligase [Lachnospiraceae bacterium]|nr:acyl--CoA ligase [Lachnospiraceae bacterium]MCM1237845.1 acyl--CoA ligase [Lachnospiraceae bacterium]